uniref:hypothetical protein n=1 Tax=Paenibacillus massiliensis TaxID=225917 RepID=UPI00056BD8E8
MFTDNSATPWAHNDGNAKGPFKYLLNLQTFAEGEGGDDDNKDALPTTAEELQKLLQAEGDKRVSQALKTAEDKWKADYESRLNSEK